MADIHNPITGRTSLATISSTVYVKVDVTQWDTDETLSYAVITQASAPSSIGQIYTLATELGSQTTNSDDLEIDLGDQPAGLAAIALCLDPTDDGTYTYAFNGVSNGTFDPTSAIDDGEDLSENAESLTFVTDDTFDSSGQTVLVVCPVEEGNTVPFTLYVVRTDRQGTSTELAPIDPHIQNGGYG